MSLLISLWLLFVGVNEPADIMSHLERVVYAQVDPVERWRPLVAEFFPAEEVETAMCIIERESGGYPGADNPHSSAAGLFQILQSLWGPHYGVSTADLYDPMTNVRIARAIWAEHGWVAWSPYLRGSCR